MQNTKLNSNNDFNSTKRFFIFIKIKEFLLLKLGIVVLMREKNLVIK